MSKPFDAAKEVKAMIAWVQDWFEKNGKGANAVIGISGGKDSSVTAWLLAKALGTDRVVGVLMPDGDQADISDSRQVVESLGIRALEINIHSAVSALQEEIDQKMRSAGIEGCEGLSRDTKINVPPRIRMSTLYAVAQSLPGGGRVANTCNRSEDYIGYSTKYGDAAGDFGLLAGFVVEQVLAIGRELGVPENLLYKAPSDGLSGMTDEDKIGFTYAVLDRYILTGECADAATREKIDRMHRANLHKLQLIPVYGSGE